MKFVILKFSNDLSVNRTMVYAEITVVQLQFLDLLHKKTYIMRKS